MRKKTNRAKKGQILIWQQIPELKNMLNYFNKI